ncbi:hypothetical protein F4678DRAFT_467461 [Xylaria arbuscula]|nr:hypothetical protein F4678DRAFT_467461 [Xylaria arbuscula]
MPRSGYDSTNCTGLQEAQRNPQTAQACPAVRTEATNIPQPGSPPVADTDSPSTSHSPPRTPTVHKSTTAQLSSSPLSSSVTSSTPSTAPLQGNPTAIQSPANIVPPSSNPIESLGSPPSTIPRTRLDRTLLPTVRVSPGYVEHTGSYQVYNNSTGRGWRYSPPTSGAVNSVRLSAQQNADRVTPGHGQRRRRQTAPQPTSGTRGINRRPSIQATQATRTLYHLNYLFQIALVCKTDQAMGNYLNRENLEIIDRDTSTKGEEKQDDEKESEKCAAAEGQ